MIGMFWATIGGRCRRISSILAWVNSAVPVFRSYISLSAHYVAQNHIETYTIKWRQGPPFRAPSKSFLACQQ